MKELVLVFIGGGTGSVLRFLCSKWFNPLFEHFFLGTFLANLISCILLGFLSYFVLAKTNLSFPVKSFLMIGVCGGFSTFSTFTMEMVNLFKEGHSGYGTLYLVSSLVLCGLGLTAGIWLSKISIGN